MPLSAAHASRGSRCSSASTRPKPPFAPLIGRRLAIIGATAGVLGLGIGFLVAGAGTGADATTAAHTFSLTARQAKEIQVVSEFIDAFNGRKLKSALAAFTTSPAYVGYVGVSDCDYRHGTATSFTGRAGVQTWLHQRFADRDHLTVSRIADEAVDQPIGGVVVEYSRRTRRSIAAAGFPHGIRPKLATKVGFTTTGHVRITAFANGPGETGGKPPECRPSD